LRQVGEKKENGEAGADLRKEENRNCGLLASRLERRTGSESLPVFVWKKIEAGPRAHATNRFRTDTWVLMERPAYGSALVRPRELRLTREERETREGGGLRSAAAGGAMTVTHSHASHPLWWRESETRKGMECGGPRTPLGLAGWSWAGFLG
jgi:hypothetical protein